jgi:transposase-like protein/IS1 family transposase
MIAPACRHTATKRHGKDRYGNQRYRCILCGQTWIKDQPKPLGQMRLEKPKAVLCLRLLLEGNSIRSVMRITGVDQNTIMALLETVGRRAIRYWETRMIDLPAMDVECDEIWGFVGCKEKTRNERQYGEEFGDAYCFTALERNTKLILAWHLGRRTTADTANFAEKLRSGVAGRFQLTADGFRPYEHIIPAVFRRQVDFAQLIKIYNIVHEGPNTRYSPGQIVDLRMHNVCGYPDPSMVSTSFVERENLNIRMAVRRMTRLTNAFSKKRENHEYHLAIYFLYHNFCRIHRTLKTTPAVAAGIATETWSVEKLLDEMAR